METVRVCVKIARAFGLEHDLLLSSSRRKPSAHGRVMSSAFACVRRPSCDNDAFFSIGSSRCLVVCAWQLFLFKE